MFIHSVYFWLRDDLTPERRAAFHDALCGLLKIATIEQGFAGTPVPSDRPVVDSSYDFALILHFADQAAHDVYQVDPVHRAFVAGQQACWTRIQVYDAVN